MWLNKGTHSEETCCHIIVIDKAFLIVVFLIHSILELLTVNNECECNVLTFCFNLRIFTSTVVYSVGFTALFIC